MRTLRITGGTTTNDQPARTHAACIVRTVGNGASPIQSIEIGQFGFMLIGGPRNDLRLWLPIEEICKLAGMVEPALADPQFNSPRP